MKLILHGAASATGGTGGSDRMGAAGGVTVEDTEDLTRLSVELRGYAPGQAPELPESLGRIEGEHAFLHIGALRLIPATRSCSWDERFARAMAYARQRGWTDQTGQLVRAHITRAGEP